MTTTTSKLPEDLLRYYSRGIVNSVYYELKSRAVGSSSSICYSNLHHEVVWARLILCLVAASTIVIVGAEEDDPPVISL